MKHKTYWQSIWHRYKMRPLGMCGLVVLALFFLVALYAPFLASSKPIMVIYDKELYFPLFRYLVSTTYFTKRIDLFFNLLGLFFPLLLASYWCRPALKKSIQIALWIIFPLSFVLFGFFVTVDPAISAHLNEQREARILQLDAPSEDETLSRAPYVLPSWDLDLKYMNDYAKLNLVLHEMNLEAQDKRISKALHNQAKAPATLYYLQESRHNQELKTLQKEIEADRTAYDRNIKEEGQQRQALKSASKATAASILTRLHELEESNEEYETLQNRQHYLLDRREWLKANQEKVSFILMPLFRHHGWQDDVGGDQALNLQLPFTDLSRINHQDLMSGLIFGSRISLFVGVAATLLALLIGVPLGLISGYFGAKVDILLCRLVEVWESMPVFFMLLLVVAMLQTKSIFVIIAVISVFSWTGAFRFVRAETFRQRELLYVDASKAIGFGSTSILLHQILPNSILAPLALLPFDIMSAITREAGLAFLGLGEEQSCSWGVLMDEGRMAFPADSGLLWPPAIVLTLLLIAIAFVGQALQEAMDPKS